MFWKSLIFTILPKKRRVERYNFLVEKMLSDLTEHICYGGPWVFVEEFIFTKTRKPFGNFPYYVGNWIDSKAENKL